MTVEWFRNTTWDEETERSFEGRLRRARRKEQYLRIQACTLARSHPEIALRLLDRYFQMPDDFDRAQAHVDRATALLTLGRTDEAIASYESALSREAAFPNVRTQAWLDLPFLIARRGLAERHARALQILRGREQDLAFPVDRFRWHAATALIAAARRGPAAAKAHAERALQAAALTHSGFPHHPSVGLVTGEFEDVIRKLEAFRST